jgi:predicted ATPase/class 3 adenylate cyclase
VSEPFAPTVRRDRDPAQRALSTFLLTDIEGSTRLWEEHPGAMGEALAAHDRLLRAAVQHAGGRVVKTTGDGLLAAFETAPAGLSAAISAQVALDATPWDETGPLRVRMAIHSGLAEVRDGDYFGPALNRTARLLAIGHGGQILTSAIAAALAQDGLPDGAELLDRGSHRLRDLDRPEQVFQVVVAGLRRDFPPLRSMSTRRSNLPVQLTSFVGRERELADVVALLGRHRLVTLIGTGGTGKTRLMLEAAGRMEGRLADGVWLAELAPLGDPLQLAPELARALGVPELPGQPAFETVAQFLVGKELLLLLDNAEHLIDPVADLAGRLLAVAPGLRILATSREALAVPGEAVVQVLSLACPPARDRLHVQPEAPSAAEIEAAKATEAVRLFAERASAVLPQFELTSANVDAVGEICRRLDGIPLAIELAAARVSAMSPEDIARRLGDRFRLLAGGRRTAVPRQQTLHALIDWSWELLGDDDRRLLRRLSVFAGGWTADAAAAVSCDEQPAPGEPPSAAAVTETLDGLTRLVDRSMVLVDRGATTRYRMLETIRQYARERLIESGEAATIADCHLAWAVGLAETSAAGLKGPAMVDWLDRLDAELENLGTALEWALEGQPEMAIRLSIALLVYWRVRVMSPDNEARIEAAVGLARQLAAQADLDPARRSLAVHLLGLAAFTWGAVGRGASAEGWADLAIELADPGVEPAARVAALTGHGLTGVFAGRPFGELKERYERLIAAALEAGDDWTLALAVGGMAGDVVAVDPQTAERLFAVARDAADRTGNPYAIATTSFAYGSILGHTGRVDEGAELIRSGAARFLALGDERFALIARSDLGHVLRGAGRLDDALAVYRETIGGWVRLGNRGAVAHQLESVAFVALARGEDGRAARLLGAAEAIREAAGSPMNTLELEEYGQHVAQLRARMPAGDLASTWSAGRALSVAAAVEGARAG